MQLVTYINKSEWPVADHSVSSNTGVMISNPTRGMGLCVRLFCVCVVLCVGSGLATWLIPRPMIPPDCA
jgi:hypothetical protein